MIKVDEPGVQTVAKRGCKFQPTKSGHLIVHRGQFSSVLPMHGKNKELGTGLVEAINKQLDLR